MKWARMAYLSKSDGSLSLPDGVAPNVLDVIVIPPPNGPDLMVVRCILGPKKGESSVVRSSRGPKGLSRPGPSGGVRRPPAPIWCSMSANRNMISSPPTGGRVGSLRLSSRAVGKAGRFRNEAAPGTWSSISKSSGSESDPCL